MNEEELDEIEEIDGIDDDDLEVEIEINPQ